MSINKQRFQDFRKKKHYSKHRIVSWVMVNKLRVKPVPPFYARNVSSQNGPYKKTKRWGNRGHYVDRATKVGGILVSEGGTSFRGSTRKAYHKSPLNAASDLREKGRRLPTKHRGNQGHYVGRTINVNGVPVSVEDGIMGSYVCRVKNINGVLTTSKKETYYEGAHPLEVKCLRVPSRKRISKIFSGVLL